MKVNDLNPGLVVKTSKYTIEEGHSACQELLQRNSEFTAILAGNDLIAMGCIDALEKAGKRVPEDISVVGGNDIPFLSRMVPSLTTINIPKYEMGAQGAQSLLELIDGSERNPVVIRMQPKLVVRKSTARLKN